MPRRDAFSNLRQADSPPAVPTSPINREEPERSQNLPTKQPLDLIPVASEKPKRNRDWDRAHRPEKVTYRGIPKRLQETITELAASLNVPRDELVRALLEYSLTDLGANRLLLVAHPKAQRMTLFPPAGSSTRRTGKQEQSTAASWLDQAFPATGRGQTPPKGKKRGKEQAKKEHWETRATYRFPVMLKEQVKAIADEHDVPVGELALFFLDYGLRAYQDGELRLSPEPRTAGKTLFPDE
mgnify:CR=1 FL=1